jgi:hypothetical protein
MSRSDDYSVDTDRREREDRAPSALDRAAEVSSRLGLTRDAAKLEMEKFLGVAEYETRKLIGQHTALRQPATLAPAAKTRRKRAASRPEAQPVEGQPTPAPEALEAPVPAPDDPDAPPAGSDQTDPES